LKSYYDHDGIILFHGENADILPRMKRRSVDLVLTDPPYEAASHNPKRRVSGKGGKLISQPIPYAQITEELREASSREMVRIAKKWVLVFCQLEGAFLWRDLLEEAGLARWGRDIGLWAKPNAMPQLTGDRPGVGYEMFVFMRQRGVPVTPEYRDVLTFNKVGGKSSLNYPGQKPLPLIRELIRMYSNPGDLILDPFCGTGTTLVAAKEMNRRAVGIERDEKVCEIAAKRLAS
jgi:site-specific DNA-methyltransferase (adenine-specific)